MVISLLVVALPVLGLAPSATARAGAVEVRSALPGAPVRIDGDLFGRTPLKVMGLEPGEHELVVGPPEHPLYRAQVVIPAGNVVRVNVPGSASDAAPGPTSWRAWFPAAGGLRPLLAQPWAYVAAAAAGLSVVGTGLLWTSSPDRLPVVGKAPVAVEAWHWNALRWGALGVSIVLLGATAVLFLLPTLPAVAAWIQPQAAPPG